MSKKVMIVDDSDAQRQVVKLNLSRAGYDVLEAVDGKQALDVLKNEDKVNLIISDVNMPVMNGIEFVQALRQDEKFKFTPIIMLTTESQEELKMEGMAAGVKAWLVKPFKVEQLLDAVSRLIS